MDLFRCARRLARCSVFSQPVAGQRFCTESAEPNTNRRRLFLRQLESRPVGHESVAEDASFRMVGGRFRTTAVADTVLASYPLWCARVFTRRSWQRAPSA